MIKPTKMRLASESATVDVDEETYAHYMQSYVKTRPCTTNTQTNSRQTGNT